MYAYHWTYLARQVARQLGILSEKEKADILD